MKSSSKIRLLASCCALGIGSSASADSVTEWNAIADAMVVGPPPIRLRVMAMAQLAVHDALNAIELRYEPYATVAPASPAAAPDAAVAAANFRVLGSAVPSLAATLAPVYAARIAALPACPIARPSCVQDGIDAGNQAADAILALRANDGSSTPHLPYLAEPGPGVYEATPLPTAPFLTTASFNGWALVTPFTMTSPSQFRMRRSRFLDMGSFQYTRDFLEVKRMGSADAETLGDRSAAQSANARFWPPASWNAIARGIAVDAGLDRWQHARLFALLNVAQADGAISVMDTKYHYNFWRPVTAIRQADDDGNVATQPDSAWLPYLVTPAYPDYTCGLTTNSGAASEILELFFGTDELPFILTAGGVTQGFESLSQARDAAVDARVHAGIHFRTGCVLGSQQGARVAGYAFRHFLRPLRGPRGLGRSALEQAEAIEQEHQAAGNQHDDAERQ